MIIRVLKTQGRVDHVELDVLTTNPAAVQFYIKHGFEIKNQKHKHYIIDHKYYDSYLMRSGGKIESVLPDLSPVKFSRKLTTWSFHNKKIIDFVGNANDKSSEICKFSDTSFIHGVGSSDDASINTKMKF